MKWAESTPQRAAFYVGVGALMVLSGMFGLLADRPALHWSVLLVVLGAASMATNAYALGRMRQSAR
jgi:hypothetical protein